MTTPRLLLLAFVGLLGQTALAQEPALPAQNWRSLHTAHFDIHYPRELEEWTRHVATRLEAVNASVSRVVGYTPTDRVTVLVDDPLNVANGYMMPGPLIGLFPTPPEPRSVIGENRDWGEMVSGHELAHVTHLIRPSRNPFNNFVRSILPVRMGPIVQAPRWVIEGYATYVEGKITGSGRPHGLWRPTILRQWALEGVLPRYSQLNASEGFYAGSMAYLAGSAFLEWLEKKEGEESLVNVWRRMTARTPRSFTSAFAGVYAASPAELYGRFTAEVTAAAVATERLVEKAGKQEGELFMRFGWYTGDPALSPDGKQIAIIQRSRFNPSRLIIFNTADDTVTDAMRQAVERVRRLDPEDVPAVDRGPRPHKQLAVLESPAGRPYDGPSFMDGGDRVLLTRVEGTGDGSVRPDLFEWRWRQNSLRRITHGASVRHPDAAPSGEWAAATQCLHGFCSVVRVALRDGALTMLAQGSVDRAFYRPRVSRDGARVVASMQEGGRWRLVIIDVRNGALSFVDPDDGASRFDADFAPDGLSVVSVSTLGGIFNLEVVDPVARTARRVSNLVGGAFAPAITPRGDSTYFLSLRATGYHVRRIALNTNAAIPDLTDSTVAVANSAAPVAVPAPQSSTLSNSTAYGVGPQRIAWAPYGGGSATGWYAGGMLTMADPVGRLGTTLVATIGGARSWRGASLQAIWRRWPVQIGAQLQLTEKHFSFAANPLLPAVELNYRGGEIFATKNFEHAARFASLSSGLWTGELKDSDGESHARALAFASLNAGAVQRSGALTFHQSLSGNYETGRTGGASWNRFSATFDATIQSPGPDLSAGVRVGRANVDAAPGEQFLIGGDFSPHLDARTSGNLVAAPLLRDAILSGDEFFQARAELSGLFPVSLFGEWTWPGGVGNDYFATGGFFISTNAPRLPQVASPELTGQIGVGTVLVGAQPRRATFFAMVKVRP